MKEKILERLDGFLESHGGYHKVAKKIDRSPQLFYSMFRRGTMPGIEIMLDLRREYEDFDFNWILFGERQEVQADAGPDEELTGRVIDLQKENEMLAARYQILESMHLQTLEKAAELKVLGKPEGEVYRLGRRPKERTGKVGFQVGTAARSYNNFRH
jgi:hypothetical protein